MALDFHIPPAPTVGHSRPNSPSFIRQLSFIYGRFWKIIGQFTDQTTRFMRTTALIKQVSIEIVSQQNPYSSHTPQPQFIPNPATSPFTPTSPQSPFIPNPQTPNHTSQPPFTPNFTTSSSAPTSPQTSFIPNPQTPNHTPQPPFTPNSTTSSSAPTPTSQNISISSLPTTPIPYQSSYQFSTDHLDRYFMERLGQNLKTILQATTTKFYNHSNDQVSLPFEQLDGEYRCVVDSDIEIEGKFDNGKISFFKITDKNGATFEGYYQEQILIITSILSADRRSLFIGRFVNGLVTDSQAIVKHKSEEGLNDFDQVFTGPIINQRHHGVIQFQSVNEEGQIQLESRLYCHGNYSTHAYDEEGLCFIYRDSYCEQRNFVKLNEYKGILSVYDQGDYHQLIRSFSYRGDIQDGYKHGQGSLTIRDEYEVEGERFETTLTYKGDFEWDHIKAPCGFYQIKIENSAASEHLPGYATFNQHGLHEAIAINQNNNQFLVIRDNEPERRLINRQGYKTIGHIQAVYTGSLLNECFRHGRGKLVSTKKLETTSNNRQVTLTYEGRFEYDEILEESGVFALEIQDLDTNETSKGEVSFSDHGRILNFITFTDEDNTCYQFDLIRGAFNHAIFLSGYGQITREDGTTIEGGIVEGREGDYDPNNQEILEDPTSSNFTNDSDSEDEGNYTDDEE